MPARNMALTHDAEGIQRDRAVCIVCGRCVEACPSGCDGDCWGGRSRLTNWCSELLKDRAYFEKSGGGVTLSGGEPALQPAFTLALMQLLREAGYSCRAGHLRVVRRRDAAKRLVAAGGSDPVRPQADRPGGTSSAGPAWATRASWRTWRWLTGDGTGVGRREDAVDPHPAHPRRDSRQRKTCERSAAYLAHPHGRRHSSAGNCAPSTTCAATSTHAWAWSGTSTDTPLMTAADLEQAGAWARASGFDPRAYSSPARRKY